MNIQDALANVAGGSDLSFGAMAEVMNSIMTGDATDAQIGALLMGLRMKGETTDEIAGAASVMRRLATPVTITAADPVDLVGTGGDGANLFNVSTAACFVVAAAGAHVAKHGNRSVSSSSGSSDVLEALGVPLDLDPTQVGTLIDTVGLGFMFAPAHHSAMRHAVGPRREMGMRTMFNVLGPLTNPAGVKRQLLGVFHAELCSPMAEVLKALGSEHAMVVHSDDGLDELSVAASSRVVELCAGEIRDYRVNPSDYGLGVDDLSGLGVNSASESAELVTAAIQPDSRLSKGPGNELSAAQKARNIIALNAGATIYVAGLTSTLADGVSRALQLLHDGAAHAKLEEFVLATQAMRK
ncbi:MAG: anthranilate phosphoribosyltransferase [Pseudomonadota bacterium]